MVFSVLGPTLYFEYAYGLLSGDMADERLSAEELIGAYSPDTPVVANDIPMTLEQALRFEAFSCTADPVDRFDPNKRTNYIARMLKAAGTLRPSHDYLLSLPE